jgi:sirohydrochlorin cobaltochelatase
LAKYDDAGSYRPLKTAPNLRHGWRLVLGSIEELHLALDLFYPAALGTWLAHEAHTLTAVPLRGTLGRQSGMYRVTQLITDVQAREVIQSTCVDGCLRQRLWTIDGVNPEAVGFSLPLPILCAEACNLLVAACRPVAKQNLPKVEAAS